MTKSKDKKVFITVKLDYSDKFCVTEILENMEYDFVYDDAIQLTEIVDIKTEEQIKQKRKVGFL